MIRQGPVRRSQAWIVAYAGASGCFIATHSSPGAYAQIRANHRLTRHVGVYVGGDIQHSTVATVGAPDREAASTSATPTAPLPA